MTPEFLSKVSEILFEKLPSRVKIGTPSLYVSYGDYMKEFFLRGGVIEAIPTCRNTLDITSPSIFFDIDPVGNISIIGSYDKIQCK